jgi:hypothetical protein
MQRLLWDVGSLARKSLSVGTNSIFSLRAVIQCRFQFSMEKEGAYQQRLALNLATGQQLRLRVSVLVSRLKQQGPVAFASERLPTRSRAEH